MDYKQLNLDTSVINPLYLDNNEKNSSEYKYQHNLALNTIQAENYINNIIISLENKIAENPNTVSSLNKLLESYLYILLSTPCISNLEGSRLSSHFSRQKLTQPDYFKSPSINYLENLIFSNYKVWGTKYGSLGYSLYLDQSTLHFAHVSTLVRLSVEKVIKDLNLNTYSSNILNVINSEGEEDDLNLYNFSTSIFKELNLLPTINKLKFIEEWVTKLLNWYSTLNENSYTINTVEYNSFEILKTISQELIKLGLFPGLIKNLSFKFLHQEIDLVVLESISTLIRLRKKLEVEVTKEILTVEEEILKDLFINLPITTSINLIIEETYRLVEIPLIGGLNFWLVTLAAELLNRAFILSHNTSFSNTKLYPVQDNNLLQLLNRVYKLIFYAGYCLKKSNLDHLRLLGFNLRTISQLEEDVNLEEYNLLT